MSSYQGTTAECDSNKHSSSQNRTSKQHLFWIQPQKSHELYSLRDDNQIAVEASRYCFVFLKTGTDGHVTMKQAHLDHTTETFSFKLTIHQFNYWKHTSFCNTFHDNTFIKPSKAQTLSKNYRFHLLRQLRWCIQQTKPLQQAPRYVSDNL